MWIQILLGWRADEHPFISLLGSLGGPLEEICA
jgi:hypothetical protein